MDTCGTLRDELIGHVKEVRANLPEGLDWQALLIVDAAPQHADDGKLQANGIRVVAIPKNMTHVFQPANRICDCLLKGINSGGLGKLAGECFCLEHN